MWSDFWYAVKRNLKQGILLGILDLVVSFLMVFNLRYYYGGLNGGFAGGIMFYLSLAMLILWFYMRFYMYLLLVTFDLSIPKILKNALIFSIIGFKRNFMATLGILVLLLLNYMVFVYVQPLGIVLPLVLTQQKVDTVSATLGDNALSTSVFAAIIGIALVMLIMIVRYRLNGVVASWALCIYTIVLFWVLAVFPGIQLTLPGIAGIVLGIGMAVDANVVIFERFNEEVRAGRSLKVALKTGFHNALSAIIDANVTTIIAAIVLMIFGTGSVQGFAKTLLLGVIVSLFSALLVTRFLMKQFIQLKNWNVSAFTSGVQSAKEAK